MELQVSLPRTEKHRNESEQDLFVSVVRYIVQVTEILELWDESVIWRVSYSVMTATSVLSRIVTICNLIECVRSKQFNDMLMSTSTLG